METASSHPPVPSDGPAVSAAAGEAGPAPATGEAVPPPGAGEAIAASAPAGGRRPRDLALSLLVLLLPVAILIGIYRIVLEGDAPIVIDPTATIAEAQADGAFPVAVPQGLSGGWRTVSASYQRGDGAAALRLGYLTPDGAGVQLVESDIPAETLLSRELTAQAGPQGNVDIQGWQWQRYSARPGEKALVLLEPGRTVIVVGTATDGELRDLAAALGP